MNPQELQKLEKKALSILEKYIKKNDVVVAAISGGADSIFLLEILKKLAQTMKVKIIIAHLNHGLRKDSDKDEAFVKNQIIQDEITVKNSTKNQQKKQIKNKFIFHSKKLNIQSLRTKEKTGIEETGRKYRYKFFNELAKKYHAKYIITAHHANDNLETVLLNFSRGASLEGLAGMQEVEKRSRERKFAQTTKLISSATLLRPLLQFSKQEILNYLKFKKIKYREDKTNKNLNYKRNFVRHKIIPQFKKINPSITETIAKNLTNLREISEFLEHMAQNWLQKNSKKITGKILISAKPFRKQPIPLQKIILLTAYQNLIGNTQNIQTTNLEEILNIIHANIGNKSKKLAKTTLYLKNNIIGLSSP